MGPIAAILPYIAAAGAVAGGVSAIVSSNQQRQAAAQARAMADANYALQQQQLTYQQALAEQQAKQNSSLMEYQASIQQRNANALLAQANAVQQGFNQSADTQKKAGVSEVDQEREAAMRFIALQKAKTGESGTTGAGTPLDSLADAAGTLELHAQETWLGIETETRRLHDVGNAQAYDLRAQASNKESDAGMSLFQAANDRWAGETAQVRTKLGMYGAELNRLDGYNTAKGYKMASYGTLFSGLASFGSAAGGLYSSGAFAGGSRVGATTYNFNSSSQEYEKAFG